MRKITLGAAAMRHPKLDGKEVLPDTIEPRIEEARALAREAARRGCDLLCLPELFADPTQGTQLARFAESPDGPINSWLSDTAKNLGMALAATVALRRGDRLTNTGVVYAKDGTLAGTYDKAHLPAGERDVASPGDGFPVFEVEGVKVGMQICYDLGFPEGCRILAVKGAELILWPNMWGGMPEQVTDVIMKARAIENQVCLVSSAFVLTGYSDFRAPKIHGRSCIIDPSGVVLAEVGVRTGVAVATLDLDAPSLDFVERCGARFPQRRPQLYGDLANLSREAKENMPDHPHLLFRAKDLGALRARTAAPFFAADWDALRRSAEAALDAPVFNDQWTAYSLGDAAARAGRLAFVGRIAEDARMLARSRELTDALLDRADEWANWMIPGMDLPFHLRMAAVCRGLALAYDVSAPDMTPEERERFVETCMDKAVRVFLKDCRPGRNPHLTGGRTMNWLAVLTSGAGMLMLAMDGDGAELSREVEIARAHVLRFIEWYGDGGSATEHGGYWRYGMGHCVEFLHALRLNGWPGIFRQRSRKLDRTPYPNLYMNIDGRNAANFGDDRNGPLDARDVVATLAAQFRDEQLQWWAGRLPPGGELTLVAADPDLPATPPDDLPTSAVFHGCGVAVLRDSLTDPDAIFLALKAGRTRGAVFDDPHCHADLNAIVVEAYGRTLLADPGYGHNWEKPTHSHGHPDHPYNGPPVHNTMLVDGAGARHEDSPLAHLQDLSPAADVDYVVSRIEQGYPPCLTRFDRHAYMIARRLFVIVDDVELTEPARLTWNFHAPKDAEIAVDGGARIVSGGAALRLTPFGPEALDARRADDHVLPRAEFNLDAPAGPTRVGWLLWPYRVGDEAEPPVASLEGDGLAVRWGDAAWRLAVVARRPGPWSAMTLIPDLKERVEREAREAP